MTWQDVEANWRSRLGGEVNIAPKAGNFIKFLGQNDCARPWFLYVETFLPAFVKLVITHSLFDWSDVVRAAGESAARGSITGGPGKTHFKKKTLDVTDPESRERAYRQGLKTVLVITKPLETLGFAFLVYGAGEQFYADWQSLLEQSVYCTRQAVMGPYGRSGSAFSLLANPDGQGFGLDTLEYNAPNFGDTVAAVTLPAGNYTVALGMKVRRQGATNATVAAGVRLFGGGTGRNFIGATATVNPETPTDLVFGGTVDVPFGETRSLAWQLYGDDIPTGYWMEQADVKITPNRYY